MLGSESDLIYLEIMSPYNFVGNFKNVEEFETWLDKGSRKELDEILQAYSDNDMFEQCVLIRDFIAKKFN